MNGFTGRASASTVSISIVTRAGYKGWLKKQNKSTAAWLRATDFQPETGKVALVAGQGGANAGKLAGVVVGAGDGVDMWTAAQLPAQLPPGRYQLAEGGGGEAVALGWALGGYEFRRYKTGDEARRPVLVWPEGCDRAAVQRAAEAIALGRDLINTPADDLGPEELATAATELAARFGGKSKVIKGKALVEGYPAIHGVGRAATSARAPRLVDFSWGAGSAPRVTLVGKGVVFDSGGLDIKPSSGMRLMKKDMGGAATVLAIAQMIMDAGLNVRLRVLIPAVENAVSGDSFRPGDVLRTRKGITVEVGNTDAEGRLILCDALAEACTESPDTIIDVATLTGAARVALGTELPALFCSDDELADQILRAGLHPERPDPLWRMPLHGPYRRFLDSPIADICNISSVSFGGAITAALFLREFVDPEVRWAHVDTMAYNQQALPGRPVGGEVFGARAIFAALEERYGRG